MPLPSWQTDLATFAVATGDKHMIEIEVDLDHEILSVIYRGHVVPKDFVDTLPDFRTKLSTMPEGFRLLTDLRDLDAMDYQCAKHIDQYMDLIDCKGVSTVVRIVPDPKKTSAS